MNKTRRSDPSKSAAAWSRMHWSNARIILERWARASIRERY